MTAMHCNDANFETEVIQSHLPVLVDFWAPWCGPCKAMSPIVDEIAGEFGGRVKVVKADVGAAPKAAAMFGVSSIPNFLVIAGGQVKAQLPGVRPKQALIDAVSAHV